MKNSKFYKILNFEKFKFLKNSENWKKSKF